MLKILLRQKSRGSKNAFHWDQTRKLWIKQNSRCSCFFHFNNDLLRAKRTDFLLIQHIEN